MRYFYFLICILLICTSCIKQTEDNQLLIGTASIESLIHNLEDSEDNQVIVVSHRGDWRNAPENSLQAIQNCIDMGVDMVEIDVRKTKDGQLVLMHDKTIDRTTNGKGKVEDFTLDSLKTFQLVDGLGSLTPNKIPTLEEALFLCKDKILVNLDKSYAIFDECYKIIIKTNTLHQVIIKGSKERTEIETEFKDYIDSVYFMPIISSSNPNAKNIVDDYLDNRVPIAFEFVIPEDTAKMINAFGDIRARGASVWVNSLWPYLNGGHDDEKAVLDPSVYNWFIDNNIDIIQTDRPKVLIDFLRNKGLHR